MEINGNQWREIGRLQADMQTVKDDVAEIRTSQATMAADISAIKSGLAIRDATQQGEARGSTKAYALVGTAAAGGGGVIAWMLAKWPWLQAIISSAPR